MLLMVELAINGHEICVGEEARIWIDIDRSGALADREEVDLIQTRSAACSHGFDREPLANGRVGSRVASPRNPMRSRPSASMAALGTRIGCARAPRGRV
jgi:hypothetical protein